MPHHPIIQGFHYQTGQPVQVKLKMASTRPAAKMGRPAQDGLRIGAPADLTVLKLGNEKASVVGTYKNGIQVFDSIS